MNWHYLQAGLVITVVLTAIAWALTAWVNHVIPNYDDPDEMPLWMSAIGCLILGSVVSVIVGWVAS